MRVDLATLLRGHPTEGECCEIAGFGPVAPSAVRDMLDTGDPLVVTRGQAVVGMAHLGRRPTPPSRRHSSSCTPTCAVVGRNRVAHREMDHARDWSVSHEAVFDPLDRLCDHHHVLKTIDGWALVEAEASETSCPPTTPATRESARRTGPLRRRDDGRSDGETAPRARREPLVASVMRHRPPEGFGSGVGLLAHITEVAARPPGTGRAVMSRASGNAAASTWRWSVVLDREGLVVTP